MAYYNGYPATYQQMYQPPVVQTPQQGQAQGLIWVQGEQAAKSYLVAPNSTVQLWDSEEKTIYLKSADASGMPSMKILDYTIRGDSSTIHSAGPEYATKDEVAALADKVRALKEEISGRRRGSKLTQEEENEQ